MAEAAMPAIWAAIAGSAASTVLGKVLGGGKSDSAPAPTPAPKPEPVNVMPTADDASVQTARKKSMLDQAQRQGRASTILTSNQDSTDKLGG